MTDRRITKLACSELVAASPTIDLMRIRSCDPEVYIIEMEFDNQVHLMTDDHGETLRFRGQTAAKKPFENLSIRAAVLVHQSAYDEMVGQPPSCNRMEVPIPVPSPDGSI